MYQYQLLLILLLPVLAWSYNIGDTVNVQFDGTPSKYNFSLPASSQAQFQFSNIQGTQFYISFTNDISAPAGLYIPDGASSFQIDTRAAGCGLQARNIQLLVEGSKGTPGSLTFTSVGVTASLPYGVNSLSVPSGDSVPSPARYLLPVTTCQNLYLAVEGAVPSLTVGCGVDLAAYIAGATCSGGSTSFSSSFIGSSDGTGLSSLSVNCGPAGDYLLNLLTTGQGPTTVDYSSTYNCDAACDANGGICFRSQCVCPTTLQSGANCDVYAYETQPLNQPFYYEDGDYIKVSVPASSSSQAVLSITYTSGNTDGILYIKKNAPATKGADPAADAIAVTLRGGQSGTTTSVCLGLDAGVSAFFTGYIVGSQGTISFATTTTAPQISSGDSRFTSSGSILFYRYTPQNTASNIVVTLTNNTAVTLAKQNAYTTPTVFSLATVATDSACASPSATRTDDFAFVNGAVVYQALNFDTPYVYIQVNAEVGTQFTINIAENPAYCPGSCSGNGVCIKGACVCSQYNSGIDCSADEPIYDPAVFPLATVGTAFTSAGSVSFRTRVPAGTLPGLSLSTNTPIQLRYNDDSSDLENSVTLNSFDGFVYSNECPTSRADSFFSASIVGQPASPSFTITPFAVNVTLGQGLNQFTFKTTKDENDYTFSHPYFQPSTCDPSQTYTVSVRGASINEDNAEVRVLVNVDDGCNSFVSLLAASDNNNVYTATFGTQGCKPFIVVVDVSQEATATPITYTIGVTAAAGCGECHNGNCVGNVCKCLPGFFGSDCSSSNAACLSPSSLSRCKATVTYPFSYAGSLAPSCSAETLLVTDFSRFSNLTTDCQAAATEVNCESALYPCSSAGLVSSSQYTGPSDEACVNLINRCGVLYDSQLSRIAALGNVFTMCGISPVSVGSTFIIPTLAPATIAPTTPATPTTPPVSSPTNTPTASRPVSTAAAVLPSSLVIVISVLMSIMLGVV